MVTPFGTSGATTVQTSKIENKLLKKISSDTKASRKAVVFLSPAKQTMSTDGESELSRTQAFLEFRKTAESTQKNILQSLKESKTKGKVANFQSFWLINAVAVEASGEEIKKIADRSDVAKIIEDFNIKIEKPRPSGKTVKMSPMALDNVEWNIKRIKAHEVWDEGYDGTGVRVGVIDSGIDGTHPDLAGKIDLFSRLNDYGELVTSSKTQDPYGHGTHVSGIIAGGDASGTSIGVAPGAKLVVSSLGWYFSYSNAIKAMEWTIDPDNNSATDDGASIVNMSWGYYMELPSFFDPVQKMISAGVLPVASIGNAGGWATAAPGNVPTTFGVGATNKSDKVTSWSSGDEVEFFDYPFTGKWIKPDISAPGDSIKSAISGLIKDWEIGGGDDVWMELSGTSMASPHIAGAAALLKDYKPSLTPTQIRLLLEASSKDLGDEGKDIRFGNGRLDVKKALDFAKTAGILKGKITYSGEGVYADVKITELGTAIRTDPRGNYKTMIPSGSYTLEVSSYGYKTKTVENVTVQKNNKTTQDISLSKSPKYTVSGKITAEATGKPIPSATISVSGKEIKGTTAQDGTYSLKLPVGKYKLLVAAKGFEKQRLSINVTDDLTENIQMAYLPDILLVNNFWGNDYIKYYKDTLDSLGKKYTLSSYATAETMKQYKTVILASENMPDALWPDWYCDEYDCYPKKSPVEKYLDSGGKLFLAGQDIGFWLSNGWWWFNGIDEEIEDEEPEHGFLSDYLYVKYIADNSRNRTLKGVQESIMDGVDFSIYNVPGENNDGANNQIWPDVMESINTKFSKDIFNYTKKTPSDWIEGEEGNGAGFAIDTGKYKAIYLSFGFESINSASTRKTVMSKSLNWLKKDTFPPTVKLNTGNGAFNGKSTLSAQVTDNKAVKKVEFLLNGNLLKSDSYAPYSVEIDTTKYNNGKYKFKVIAYDTSNNKSESERQIVFDNTKPKISILYPTKDMTLSGKFKIKASASDNYEIENVSFYVDTKKISSSNITPYEKLLDSSEFINGTRTIKAIVRDKAGNTDTASVDVKFNNLYEATITIKPNPFSPDGDEYQDKTVINYELNQPGIVSIYISKYGEVILQPLYKVHKARGSYSFTWNGKTKDDLFVKNGSYRLNFAISGFQQSYSTYKTITVKIPPMVVSDASSQPNPFSPNGDGHNDKTKIKFTLNHRANVTVAVYNSKGKIATLLDNKSMNSGTNSVIWDGKDDNGNVLQNSTYRCSITAKDVNGSTSTVDLSISIKN